MFLTAIFITWLGYQFGKGQGWWGSMRSGGSSGGGRSRPSGGSRTSGPRTGGSSTASGAVRGVGERIGRALGWRDAKRIHDRGEPPVTWGDAWREGMDAGRQRGRERFDEGQQRRAEKLARREEQDAWLERIEQRAGQPIDGQYRRGFKRLGRRLERNRTCAECGHGSDLNPSREACPCDGDCPCGLGVEADTVGPDIEDQYPDYSKPLNDEQRWGPPDAADEPAPVDEVAEKRRERDPEAITDPRHPDYAGAPHRAEFAGSEPPAPTGDGTPENEETSVSAPTAPAPSMSGEIINFDSARGVLRGISADMQNLSDAATETAAKHRATVAACDAAIDGLTAIDSDPDTIGDFLALREQAMQALEAAERAQVEAAESSSYATTVIGNIDQRHGAIEEAVRSSAHAAKIEAYRAS